MRILQVATLITPDNAYGGPVTVAVNQCRALLDAGHDVTLVAAHSGFHEAAPESIEGVPVRLFPARRVLPGDGFAQTGSPGMMKWLARNVGSNDVVHVHLARDLVTMPAAALALARRKPLYLQTHGMIDPSSKLLARPLDAVLTRRVLRGARCVFYLTDIERSALVEVAGDRLSLECLPNGVPIPAVPQRPVPSAQVRVLYLARLQERKRPLVFIASCAALGEEFPETTFTLVGPDEGQGEEVRRAIGEAGLGERLQWVGPRDREGCRQAMLESDLYVLPSVDEPYPMSVLEAMSMALPVVVTESCGLAPAVQRGGAGYVVDEVPSSLTTAMRELLSDPVRCMDAGQRARTLTENEFGMDAIRDQLVHAYSRVISP